ncbi:MAG: DNA polymerase III subunit alpha [Ignavibacterium sp.]|nr:DNA polymerase III subunit alpha [Ignavibacterium sp.]
MSDFIHLHNHTHYSLQDGACTVDGLINAALKHGMRSVAITDHGVLYGVAEFYNKAKKSGIKPIIGMEAYIVVDGSRFDRGKADEVNSKKRSKHYNHLIILAKNKQGYDNLSRLSTLGHTEGFYYKPRIDMELLEKYKEGLIITSACANGVVSAHLVNNDYEKARSVAKRFKDLFDEDFYLEIQDHGMDIDKPILESMPKLSKELGIKLVATNDCHYIEQDHAIAHNILLLLSDKNNTDYTQLRYGTDQVYFKSSDEMKKLFKKYKGAIENTLEIDEKVNIKFDFEEHHFPDFPIPEESKAKNLDEYMELLAREGLEKKFKTISKEIEDRFNFEIKTIKEMGFAGYFLVVADFINNAKQKNIPVGPGRGSAAGSIVAYAMGITNVDPLKYDLLFERFLNPARRSMPDIDVDFADDKRSDVIDYVREKYGAECVSQIITFNKLTSKAVLRDVARVLKIPIPTVNKITKFIPSKFGKVYSIDQALAEVPDLKWVKESTETDIQNLLKYARVLEGMNRNASKHAAGVVITPDEVSKYVPLANAVSQQDIVTQFSMKDIENAGLLKMDFLGLRTLTIIRDTIDMVRKNHNKEIDIDNIPLDDEKTFQLFSKGQTTGVFQFESGPMREYLKQLRPASLNDLAAMNALYRPGPMENIDDFIDRKLGRKVVNYSHPILEPILKETYGVIVYQEQVIQIANKVGGMSLADADLLRRAMGKKDLKVMQEQKVVFTEGAVKNGVNKKVASNIFETIFKFANYGFNKSHAVAYSLIAYQTAYLKAYFPAEFLAANLKNEFENTDKITKFLDDCRKQKIEVLPPDINNPSLFFEAENGKIKFGMSAIKNVGVPAVKEIINAKNKLGRNFKSIYDFCINTDNRIVTKRALEGLVLAGAFHNINKNRAQLFESIESALTFAHKLQNSKMLSSDSLFGGTEEVLLKEPELPDVKEWSEKEYLAQERKVIGFYLTDHPLRKYELEFNSFASIHLGETEGIEEKGDVRACGVVTELKTKFDKAGKMMAFFKLDDLTGSCECLMFSKAYDEFGKYVQDEEPVFAVGSLESSGDAVKMQVSKVIPMKNVANELTESIRLLVSKQKVSAEKLKLLKNIFEKSEGSIPVFINLTENGIDKGKLFSLTENRVKITPELLNSLNSLLGEDAVILKSK